MTYSEPELNYVELHDNLDRAYEQGVYDAFNSKIRLKLDYDEEEKRWYWKGYGDQIFGETKDVRRI